MSSDKLTVTNHGTGKIAIVTDTESVIETDLTHLHLKEDGTVDDKPSLAFESIVPGYIFVSQISLKMLNDALNELGYQITKNP